jgi:hypothetical protein
VHREKVIEDEIEKIVERRRNVGFVGKEDPRKTLVGLTLSGGGIRSASFNLGLLQAFYQHGLLRFVDYMSTVSGGGYIGAYLSSQVSKLASANKDFYKILDMPPSAVASNHAPPAQSANRPSGAPLNETPPATVQTVADTAREAPEQDERILRKDPSHVETKARTRSGSRTDTDDCRGQDQPVAAAVAEFLKPEDQGKQPPEVLKLIRSGKYLNHGLVFSNRYLVSLFLNNVVLFSFLICSCSLVAFLWRCLDFIPVRWWIEDRFQDFGRGLDVLTSWTSWLPYLGSQINYRAVGTLSDDLYISFLPSFALLFFWALIWTPAYFLHRRFPDRKYFAEKTTRFLLLLAGICCLIGIAVVLGDGDISLGEIGFERHFEGGRIIVSKSFLAVVGVLLVVGLLPMLRPWRLLGSGQQPKNLAEKYIFAMASTALLAGIPLVLVFFLGRENISGFATHSIDDLNDWNRFWTRVVQQRNSWPARGIWAQLEEDGDEDIDGKLTDQLRRNPTLTVGLLKDTTVTKIGRRRQRLLHSLNNALSSKKLAVIQTRSDFSPVEKPLPDVVALVYPKEWQAVLLAGSGHTPLVLLGSVVSFRDNLALEAAKQHYKHFRLATADNEEQRTRLKKEVEKTLQRLEYLLTKHYYFRDLERIIEGAQTGSDLKDYQRVVDEYKTGDQNVYTRKMNRLLLSVFYPEDIPDTTIVKRVIVINKDQKARLRWLFWSLLIFALSACVVNLNKTSMHGFYRDQLAGTYLAEDATQQTALYLEDMKNTEKGAPYHLFAASLLLFPGVWKSIFGTTPHQAKRVAKSKDSSSTEFEATDGFLFSQLFCGSDHTGYVRTKDYSINGDKPELANVMAISGAAVSPFRMRSLLTRMVMLVLNIRLGQWLPHPKHLPWPSTPPKDKRPGGPSKLNSPSVIKLLGADIWGTVERAIKFVLSQPSFMGLAWSSWFRESGNRVYSFVSDGGHHENLGLWPLLQRRCFFIIVSDASQDNQHTFEDFLRLCRRVRLLEGIEFVELNRDEKTQRDVPFQLYSLGLHPDSPQPGAPRYLPSMAARFSQRHYVAARIKYPKQKGKGPQEGYLVYVKASLTGDEESDLLGFGRENKAFPHDPTAHPMFDEDQVESYRQLGYHIGEKMCEDIVADPEDSLWNGREFDVVNIVKKWLWQSGLERHPFGKNGSGDFDVATLLGLQEPREVREWSVTP